MFRQLFGRMIVIYVVSLAALLFAGWVLDTVQGYAHSYMSFFHYRLRAIDMPAWFAACLMLSVINGFALIRLAAVEGEARTGHWLQGGRWGLFVPANPTRYWAVQLIAIPAILLLVVIVRESCW